MMRVLMVSTDRKILIPGSQVRERMVSYGPLFAELHIVLFTLAPAQQLMVQIAPNVFVYPTHSRSKLEYISDAIKIGRQVLSQVFFGQTVISVQDPFETGIVGVFLKRLLKFPLQVQLHTDAWSNHFQYSSFLNWVRVNIIARITLRAADGVRVVSEKIQRDVIVHAHLPFKKVSVLPVYVDVDWYKGSPRGIDLHQMYPQWKTIILMSSRLTKEKRIDLALKVMKKIVPLYPDVGLVIAGEGPEENHLQKLVGRYKLSKNVAFIGWQDDLSSCFKTADIFLTTSDFEGYGMTTVEAGAAGIAVLTTQVGVAASLLKEGINASICPVGDQTCLFNKMVNMIENPHLRKSMAQALQSEVFRVTLSRSAYEKRYVELLESIQS